MQWWNRYIGIPFAEKGRTLEGCDCWGLVRLVYQIELGIKLPSYDACYETTQDRDALAKVIAEERASRWLHPEKPQAMDVIILNMRGVPMHVGLVTKPGHMIHCAQGIDTVHEKFDTMRWHHNVKGFARYG